MHFVTIRHPAWGLALGILAAVAARPVRAQSTDMGSYVLFATDELRSRGLTVERGDVGVNGGNLFVRTGVVLDAPNSILSADRASIPVDAKCARLIARSPGEAAASCPAVTTFVPPFGSADAVGAACGYPDPFPACSSDPSRNVELQPGEARTLDPGTYGIVSVRSSSSARTTLQFRPGVYQLCGLRTSRGAQLVFEGATQLYVAGTVRIGSQSVVNPGGNVDSHLIDLFASGGIVRLAREADATLRVCAPFSTVRMGRGVRAFGRFVGKSIVAAGLQTGLPTTTTTSTSTSITTSTSTSITTTTSSSTSITTSTSTSITTTTSSSTVTTSSSTSTTSTSVPPRCGDGLVNQASEECDDGNEVDDDCCSNACTSAPDGVPCGAGDVCSGDQTCQTGVCTPTTQTAALECVVPFSDAIITNFDDGTAAALALGNDALGDAVAVGRGAWGVAVRPGGQEVWVTARDDNRITVLDAADRSVLGTITAGMVPLGIVFDPTGERAYVASFSNDRVVVIDADTRSATANIAVGKGPSGLALDAGGNRLYVSNYVGNSISVIDLATQKVTATVKTKKRPLELALDAGRGRLYITNFAAKRVSILGTISDSILATVRVGRKPFGVAVDPATNRAYVTNAVDDTVSVVDGARCEQSSVIDVGDGPLGIGLDLPATRAIVANSNGASISVIDTATEQVTSTIGVGKTPVAFGGFVGARANDCPRAPLVCDDGNPMTLDSCTTALGCAYTPYPPEEAAQIGIGRRRQTAGACGRGAAP